MARKGIPWGPSNPLWKWQHGKANKPASTHRSPVRHMTKKKSRRYFSRIRRRRGRGDRRIPILPAVGLALGVIGNGTWGKPVYQHFLDGEYELGLRALGISFTGIDFAALQYGWQYQKATGLWGLVGGMIGSNIASAAGANKVIKRIPIIGSRIKL